MEACMTVKVGWQMKKLWTLPPGFPNPQATEVCSIVSLPRRFLVEGPRGLREGKAISSDLLVRLFRAAFSPSLLSWTISATNDSRSHCLARSAVFILTAFC
jgi:hypothetical protein